MKYARNYCSVRRDLLSGGICNSVEDYLRITVMDRAASRGTDLEIFLSALILKTDIFVFKDDDQCWMKFSGYGFSGKNSRNELTENRVYLRLHMGYFQPIMKVKDESSMLTE